MCETVCSAFWLLGVWKEHGNISEGQEFTNLGSNRSRDDLDFEPDAMDAIKMRQ